MWTTHSSVQKLPLACSLCTVNTFTLSFYASCLWIDIFYKQHFWQCDFNFFYTILTIDDINLVVNLTLDLWAAFFLVLLLPFRRKTRLIKWASVCVVYVCEILISHNNFQISYLSDMKFWLHILSYCNSPMPLIIFFNFQNWGQEKFSELIFSPFTCIMRSINMVTQLTCTWKIPRCTNPIMVFLGFPIVAMVTQSTCSWEIPRMFQSDYGSFGMSHRGKIYIGI